MVDWKRVEQDLTMVIKMHGIDTQLKLNHASLVKEVSCVLKTQYSLLKTREPWLDDLVTRASASQRGRGGEDAISVV